MSQSRPFGAAARSRAAAAPLRIDTRVDALSDADLVARVRRGDEEALGLIYDRHIRTVWKVALYFARTPAVAEAAVLAAFGRLWSEPRAHGGRCLSARLLTSVAHEARSRRAR